MEKIGYTRNSKGATGKQAVPRCWLKEVTAIFVRDGRLLLFAVTDLDNEADHTDHKNTKLE